MLAFRTGRFSAGKTECRMQVSNVDKNTVEQSNTVTKVNSYLQFTDPQNRIEADKIQADWSQPSHRQSEAEIKRAALLAWEGHLTSVECMEIRNMSITDIPRDHMEILASIDNVTQANQLGRILASVKCSVLCLRDMELSEEETRALVTAMRDRVEDVWLYEDVTLDIEELTQYDGQGRCRWLVVVGDTRARDRLRRWAADKGWTLTRDNVWGLVMQRK